MRIHEAVFAAALRDPDAVAVVDDTGRGTRYADLAGAAAALAETLRARFPRGSRIAIPAAKSTGTIIGMLAVLDAGMAYVPVDVGAPQARARFVLRDAGCVAVLAHSPAPVPADGVELIDPGEAITQAPPPVRGRGVVAAPDDEAYVLYTSGSTGTPKGVRITHRNASAFVRWAARAFPLRPGDRVAVHAPLHFDLPVYDLYVGLAAGATLHPVPSRAALFPQGFFRFLTDRSITHLYAVPSALTALVNRSTLGAEGLPALRRVLYAGEEFAPRALAEFMRAVPGAAVANLYGPIETNVVTSFAVPEPPGARVPIGRPVEGVVVALLAEDGTLSFGGAADGEILVCGDCVTPGYLGRPDATAAAELHAPDGRRFYRTGDYARRDGDGLLHLRGRRDGLVKTRGYRVELGEIEAVLSQHPGVAEAAVIAEPDPALTHRITAFIIPAGEAGDGLVEDVTRHCRARLASYMVPERIEAVADLPRTSTGKIARNALPRPAGTGR